MRSIVAGATLLGVGCVAYVIMLYCALSVIVTGDYVGSTAAAIGISLIAGFAIGNGFLLLLEEPFTDEEAIALAQRVFGANVNN